jgi:hypothetical protein
MKMNGRETLHELVDALPDDMTEDALEYLYWLLAESDTLTEDEVKAVEAGKAELARGEYVTLDEVKRRLAS